MSVRTCVIGLSDIGRSPRLQNHAVSLSKQAGHHVDIVGFQGSTPLQELLADPNIQLHHVQNSLSFGQLPKALALPLKALLQLWRVLVMLFSLPKADFVLLQVPPAIPTLFICWLVCWIRGSYLIIDWHNFAYTLMALNYGKTNLMVRVAAAHERFWGRQGQAHLCVTHAMKRELESNWGIVARAFHDKAPASFSPTSLQSKHDLLLRLHSELRTGVHPHDCLAGGFPAATSIEETMCTRMEGNEPFLREDRPALVVSSTSWTPDEGFGMLLEAASEYDRQSRQGPLAGRLPRLLILVTGKGPQKGMYLGKMRSLDLRNVAFRTLWLDPGDYPLLLGACDAGISLHTSSSGLDLPMKVVDMFGCGLPVLTAAYACISELVQDNATGLHFSTAKQLGRHLVELFCDFPAKGARLDALRAEVLKSRRNRGTWESEWEKVVKPLFETPTNAIPVRRSGEYKSSSA